jgi:RimJ/RimL family protein N-acetyltransferase
MGTGLTLRAWTPEAAISVFRWLDPSDYMEACVVRGVTHASHLDLFADWRAAQAGSVLSLILFWNDRPFAVLALGNTGQYGVAQGAFLARDHTTYRRGIASAAGRIRRELVEYCTTVGIRRIEARSWDRHPRAAAFLTAVGFHAEQTMDGFGPDGTSRFVQFTFLTPTPSSKEI